MEDFLKFRKMITPVIIQVLFWIGALVCVIWGIVAIEHGGPLALVGLLALLLGPLVVRIYCETFIVLFSINDTLTEIKNKMRDTIG